MDKEVVFLSGARVPFGTFGGSLKDISATDLAVIAAKAALGRAGIAPDRIGHVIFGNVMETSPDAIYQARHTALKVGIPLEVPAYNVNRLCTSGFQAIIEGAQHLLLGEADFVLAGGTENMSQAPHVIRGARWGIPLGQIPMTDFLMDSLTDSYCGCGMAITAENLAVKYGIKREEVDEYAFRSQMAAKAAIEEGRLTDEIVPVEIKDRKGNVTKFMVDEHPKPYTTLEGLAKLKPFFKEGGVVTAGNASGISDGAAAMVMTTMERARAEGVKPIGRLIAWGVAGCPPEIMGIGPVPASKIAFERGGLTLDRMDLIEVNEAFAAQYLAVEKEMGLERGKVNVNGGAVAIGHPIGASGTRLTLTLLYELRRRKGNYGLATACAGGGQGVALIVEALN